MGGFQESRFSLRILFHGLVVFAHDVTDHGIGRQAGSLFKDEVTGFGLSRAGEALPVFKEKGGLIFQKRVEFLVIIHGAFEYLHVKIDLFGFPAFVGLFPFLLSGGEEIDREKQEQVEDAGEPTGTPLHRGTLCQEQREEDEKGQHAERVRKAGKNEERG